ncbi:hypothetical protein ACH5RR_033785 [Cinchona calisaya]|uniref:Uncharacterized protein n=1 Tax=Cinchona calisaya TaxID=153742 RepID=A0ABD2YCU2_9GENT
MIDKPIESVFVIVEPHVVTVAPTIGPLLNTYIVNPYTDVDLTVNAPIDNHESANNIGSFDQFGDDHNGIFRHKNKSLHNENDVVDTLSDSNEVVHESGETASLSFGSSFAFRRIAVARAKPAFFALRMKKAKLEGYYPNRLVSGIRRGPSNHTTAVKKACSL